LLFGGLTGSAGSPVTNDLWSYREDDGSNRWKHLDVKGPGCRMYAASAILDGSFYLFGGWDPGEKGSGGTFKDDVWRLDLDAMQWHEEDPLPCGPVSRHAACTVGEKIIVHTFRGVLVCHLRDGKMKITEQTSSGEAPEGLSMCAVTSIGESSMLLFGGSTKMQELSSDAFVLDTTTWTWLKLKGTGGPCARASPCMAPLDASKCIIFGGASLGESGYEGGRGLVAQGDTWIIDVNGDVAEWEQIATTGPEARIAASLSSLPSGGYLLQGGWDPTSKETYDIPWLLRR